MKGIMKRAWEIYRTLTGNRLGKLSYALKAAWAEKKSNLSKIKSMIYKYDIKLVGDKIAVAAPKYNKNMEQLNWIKDHKADIIAELTRREEENAKREEENKKRKATMDAAFKELRKTNPEMRRGNYLTEKAIARVVVDGWSISAAISEYRVYYVDAMDASYSR